MATRILWPTYAVSGWAANVDDDFGVRWVVTTQDATDGPTPKTRISERPYGAGAYRAVSFPASNPITLQGWGRAPGGRPSVMAARKQLFGLFTDGGQRLLVIDDGLVPRQALVELAAKPKFTIWPDCSGFDWQLPLLATDPRLYDTATQAGSTTLPTPGAVGLDWVTGGGLNWVTGGGLNWGTTTSNGTFSMANTGNADTWPTFTLTGPLTGPVTITNNATGQQLTYSNTLGAGDSLVITTDPAKRSVLLNGSDRFTLMTSASWFSIPASSAVTVALAASAGSGSLSASWQNASW
jgi:hypothetical protein